MSEELTIQQVLPEAFRIGSFALTPTSMQCYGTPTYDNWVTVMSYLKTVNGAIQFWLGDCVNFGEREFHEQASQIVDASELTEETIRVYTWVAKSVPARNRRTDLSFYHHQIVAAMPEEEQKGWLEKAATGDPDGAGPWSSGKLKAKMKASNVESNSISYVLVIHFDSLADRDICAQEHARHGRQVEKRESTRPTPKD